MTAAEDWARLSWYGQRHPRLVALLCANAARLRAAKRRRARLILAAHGLQLGACL